MGDLEGERKEEVVPRPLPWPKRVLEAEPSASSLVQLGG